MLTVLIVDDHYLVGEGTKTIVESNGEFTANYVSTAEEALSINDLYDLYIIDIQMPNVSGKELLKRLIEKFVDPKIILYTGYENQISLSLFTEYGLSGIINKTATQEDLFRLIYAVLRGETILPLSIFKEKVDRSIYDLGERDLFILRSISEGLNTKEIADRLFLSDRTIEYCLSKIYKNLGVKTRGEAVSTAIQLKLFDA